MAGAVQSSPPCFEPPTREAALSIVALAATLLFAHGVTTERTVVTAERLGRALGVPVRVLPDWGELIVEIEGTSLSQIVPTKPLGVDMNRVLAITTVGCAKERYAARKRGGRCCWLETCYQSPHYASRHLLPSARRRSGSFSALSMPQA
jgi:hypothetical protein